MSNKTVSFSSRAPCPELIHIGTLLENAVTTLTFDFTHNPDLPLLQSSVPVIHIQSGVRIIEAAELTITDGIIKYTVPDSVTAYTSSLRASISFTSASRQVWASENMTLIVTPRAAGDKNMDFEPSILSQILADMQVLKADAKTIRAAAEYREPWDVQTVPTPVPFGTVDNLPPKLIITGTDTPGETVLTATGRQRFDYLSADITYDDNGTAKPGVILDDGWITCARTVSGQFVMTVPVRLTPGRTYTIKTEIEYPESWAPGSYSIRLYVRNITAGTEGLHSISGATFAAPDDGLISLSYRTTGTVKADSPRFRLMLVGGSYLALDIPHEPYKSNSYILPQPPAGQKETIIPDGFVLYRDGYLQQTGSGVTVSARAQEAYRYIYKAVIPAVVSSVTASRMDDTGLPFAGLRHAKISVYRSGSSKISELYTPDGDDRVVAGYAASSPSGNFAVGDRILMEGR